MTKEQMNEKIKKKLRRELLDFYKKFKTAPYDNHNLDARYLGYSNQELFELSQRILRAPGR